MEPAGDPQQRDDERFMRIAIEQARAALECGEVPVGCAFVREGTVLGTGHNETNATMNVREGCASLETTLTVAGTGDTARRAGGNRSHIDDARCLGAAWMHIVCCMRPRLPLVSRANVLLRYAQVCDH